MTKSLATRCVTCGTDATGPYCAQCGESTVHPDYSLKHFAHDCVEALTELDGRVLWTFRALIARPGVLARDFLAGRRKGQYGPVKLFVICNVVYFLIQPFTLFAPFTSTLSIQTTERIWHTMARSLVDARLADRAQTFEQYAPLYDETAHLQGKSLVFLMVPLFALGAWAVHRRTRRFYTENLVYSFYLYAFVLLWMAFSTLVLTGVFRAGLRAGFALTGDWLETVSTPVVAVPFVAYLLLSERAVYRESWRATVVKTAILTAWVFAVLWAYRFILFFTALYAT
jgi:uncharacterized protein DUF3667